MQPVAFTPKGGCPLKPPTVVGNIPVVAVGVAFTPKGGCPLKQFASVRRVQDCPCVAFTPKGGCPLKPSGVGYNTDRLMHRVGFTPKGGCLLKLLRENDHAKTN